MYFVLSIICDHNLFHHVLRLQCNDLDSSPVYGSKVIPTYYLNN